MQQSQVCCNCMRIDDSSDCMDMIVQYYIVLLACTNRTHQISISVIWWAVYANAGCFHVEEVSTTVIFSTSRESFQSFVNTFKHGSFITNVIRHEVTYVLQGPFFRTDHFGWTHELGNPSSHLTNCTGTIMIILDTIRCRVLILNTINFTIALNASPCKL